jgi:hypothetical protein
LNILSSLAAVEAALEQEFAGKEAAVQAVLELAPDLALPLELTTPLRSVAVALGPLALRQMALTLCLAPSHLLVAVLVDI